MQISIKLLSIMLLSCFAQTTYSSIERFLGEARPWQAKLQKLINHFCERDLPSGLASATNDQSSLHAIIAQSIQLDQEAPFQARGTVITKWVKNLLETTNPKPQDNVWIHRSITHVPDTCKPEDLLTTKTRTCLTFTTTTGGVCHTDYLTSTIVFAQDSNPKDFNSIPPLKALLTYLLSQPNKPKAITTKEFYISRNGNPNDNALLAKHIEQTQKLRYSYATVEVYRKKIQKGECDVAIGRSFLINDKLSMTDEVDWSKLNTQNKKI